MEPIFMGTTPMVGRSDGNTCHSLIGTDG